MKKNGYTLIELIAVIVIIGLVSTIVVLNFDNIIGKSDNKKEQSFTKDLEKSACVYIDLKENITYKNTCYPSKHCSVTASQLITSGLISDELIDPTTNNKVNKNLVINISWDENGTKSCTLNR